MRVPPLVRFVGLGCLLFAVDKVSAPAASTGTGEPITLSTTTQELLVAEARDRLGRTPTPEEAEQALRSWEDTSLLAADARALGLDRGDPIVNRRLVKKMRYLLDDATTTREPTVDELEAHLAANQEAFRMPIRLALEQRFFDRGARGAALDTDARAALAALTSGQPASPTVQGEEETADPTAGDPHKAGPVLPIQTRRQLADTFGGPFARSVVEAPVGAWSGPYPSSRGLHLVRVTEREASRPARLEEVRRLVEASWRQAQRKLDSRARLDALRARHGLPARGAP